MSDNATQSAFDGRTVLITGATGSFGKAMIDKLLAEHQPTAIRCFSRDELKQSELQQRYADDDRLRYMLGDVRDLPRLSRACQGVDVIVHAAALKQVRALDRQGGQPGQPLRRGQALCGEDHQPGKRLCRPLPGSLQLGPLRQRGRQPRQRDPALQGAGRVPWHGSTGDLACVTRWRGNTGGFRARTRPYGAYGVNTAGEE